MEISVVRREPIHIAEDGIVLAEAQIALPEAMEGTHAHRAVNRFYKRIGDALEGITRNVLAPQSRALYERSDDPRKRFTHRPFRLSCDCRITEGADGITLVRSVTVRHRGRVIFERKDHERITEGGLVLPWKEKSPK